MTTLAQQVEQTSAKAIAQGALLPLRVESTLINENGLAYSINHLSSLSLKDMATAMQKSGGTNPFSPYEETLFVTDLSPTHLLLLNKFPLVMYHSMAITREFVPQSSPLGTADFAALARLFRDIDGLMMYNGGATAGASQPHRHLHMMPGRTAPLAAIYPHGDTGKILQVDAFRFIHAFTRLDASRVSETNYLQHTIEAALAHCNLHPVNNEMPAYNLLGTREWLLVVPRSKGTVAINGVTVHVSAMDFGGQISVRSTDQTQVVKQTGLLSILEAAAVMKK